MGLSYKAKIYGYKDGPSLATTYKKYVTTWYDKVDYSGNTTVVTTDRVTEYN